jgi:hypothetical protein
MERHLRWMSGDNLSIYVGNMTEHLQTALTGEPVMMDNYSIRPHYNRPRRLFLRNHFNISVLLVPKENPDQAQTDAQDTRCPICLEDFTIENVGLKPDCGHIHCCNCLDMYLTSKQNQAPNQGEDVNIIRCSLCRTQITKLETSNTDIYHSLKSKHFS